MSLRMSLPSLALSALCSLAAGAVPATALAGPHHEFRPAVQDHDAGPTASDATITTSIYLNVVHPEELNEFVRATLTPGDPNYHHFLSVEQFRHRFAPSDSQIQSFVRYLRSFGITIDKIYADHLDITATGTAAEFNAAFSTQLRNYTHDGEQFHRPAWKFAMPGTLANLVLAVPGLSNAPGAFRPKIARLGQGAYAKLTPPPVRWPSSGTATGIPQEYTVGDVANFYGVNPLYNEGIDGRGETVGIMTLANFNVSDVYAYWNDIGLRVRHHRITKVAVDGGTPVTAGVGDDETSLDVEQSGGLAPQARIRVYIAPNTNEGFIDLFYSAASDNIADTVSISWGEPEEFFFAALNGGVDYTGQLQAINEALEEGAAQGQSFFAAAGDAGAYDINNSQIAPIPQYSMQLSVDAPGSDPYITAAGGTTWKTTVPGIAKYGCPAITLSSEQVWGWDYLNTDWGSCLGLPPDALFPVGGGGGVSSYWPRPFYQQFLPGMQLTQPDQSLIYYPNYPSTDGQQTLITLPGNFAGRNMPDLSLNADPETGYILIDCTDFPEPANPYCAAAGYGGTSFVAPQLNGITALIDEAAGGRVGLLNPVVYAMDSVFDGDRQSMFNDITAGDNWFYDGVPGYDDGAGIGSINAAVLARGYEFLSDIDSNSGDHHHHH